MFECQQRFGFTLHRAFSLACPMRGSRPPKSPAIDTREHGGAAHCGSETAVRRSMSRGISRARQPSVKEQIAIFCPEFFTDEELREAIVGDREPTTARPLGGPSAQSGPHRNSTRRSGMVTTLSPSGSFTKILSHAGLQAPTGKRP